LDPALLEGVDIPNLVALPFAVNKAYAELIYNRTSSPRLSKVLRKWDDQRWDAPERRQNLARVLLIELLSYQFASLGLVLRKIQIRAFHQGWPVSDARGLAICTLKAKYETKHDSTGHV